MNPNESRVFSIDSKNFWTLIRASNFSRKSSLYRFNNMDHVMFYKYEIRIRLIRLRLFVEVMNSFTDDYLESKKNINSSK